MDFLNDNSSISDSSFSLDTHVCKVRVTVKSSEHVIHVIGSDREKKLILIPNATPPRFYELPKTHKEKVPVRLVVSFISSHTYKLTK